MLFVKSFFGLELMVRIVLFLRLNRLFTTIKCSLRKCFSYGMLGISGFQLRGTIRSCHNWIRVYGTWCLVQWSLYFLLVHTSWMERSRNREIHVISFNSSKCKKSQARSCAQIINLFFSIELHGQRCYLTCFGYQSSYDFIPQIWF